MGTARGFGVYFYKKNTKIPEGTLRRLGFNAYLNRARPQFDDDGSVVVELAHEGMAISKGNTIPWSPAREHSWSPGFYSGEIRGSAIRISVEDKIARMRLTQLSFLDEDRL